MIKKVIWGKKNIETNKSVKIVLSPEKHYFFDTFKWLGVSPLHENILKYTKLWVSPEIYKKVTSRETKLQHY